MATGERQTCKTEPILARIAKTLNNTKDLVQNVNTDRGTIDTDGVIDWQNLVNDVIIQDPQIKRNRRTINGIEKEKSQKRGRPRKSHEIASKNAKSTRLPEQIRK